MKIDRNDSAIIFHPGGNINIIIATNKDEPLPRHSLFAAAIGTLIEAPNQELMEIIYSRMEEIRAMGLNPTAH
jgi:hypothetical protein